MKNSTHSFTHSLIHSFTHSFGTFLQFFNSSTLQLFLPLLLLASCSTPSPSLPSAVTWPDTIPWWKANNLRVIQANLPAYEA